MTEDPANNEARHAHRERIAELEREVEGWKDQCGQLEIDLSYSNAVANEAEAKVKRLTFALKELAHYGKNGGKDCWCEVSKDKYDDDRWHSPGCRAARAALKGEKDG